MLPQTDFVKRSDVLSLGITPWEYRKMIESGQLKRRILPGCKYGLFERRHVEQVLKLNEKGELR